MSTITRCCDIDCLASNIECCYCTHVTQDNGSNGDRDMCSVCLAEIQERLK